LGLGLWLVSQGQRLTPTLTPTLTLTLTLALTLTLTLALTPTPTHTKRRLVRIERPGPSDHLPSPTPLM